MPYLSNDMQLDSSLKLDDNDTQNEVFPEVDIYLSLLLILRLIDNSSLSQVSFICLL